MLDMRPPTPEPLLLHRGPPGLSNAGLFLGCFWHFYLLSHKALESSDLGMNSCLHKHRGDRWGLVPTSLESRLFCNSSS